MMLVILAFAWLLVYRTTVGTWCAATGKETPWAAERKAKLAHAQAKAAAGLGGSTPDSRRSMRGFLGRLWGNLWEDANGIVDRHRGRVANRREQDLPGGWASFGNWLAGTGRAGMGWLADLAAAWRERKAHRARQSRDRHTPKPTTPTTATWQSRRRTPPAATTGPTPQGRRARPPAPPNIHAPTKKPSQRPSPALLPTAPPMAAPPPPQLALPAGRSASNS